MLLDRVRVAAILLGLGLGGSYWAWHAFASTLDGPAQAHPGPAAVRAPAPSPRPRTDGYGDPLPPGAALRLGTVRFRQAPDIRHIVHSPDGQLLVTDSGQSRLLVWDARDGKKLREIELGIEGIRDLVFSPDGRTMAAVGFQLEPKRNVVLNHLVFIDVATGRLVRRGEWDDPHNVEKVAYVPDGKIVATMSLDGALRVWDVATATIRHHQRLVGERMLSPESIAFSRYGANRWVAIVQDQTIDLWEVGQLRRSRTIAVERDDRPNGLAFSPDGSILAAGVGSRGAEIRLWHVGDGTMLRHFESRKNTHVSHMSFSPDGKVLAAIGRGGAFVSFDAATGTEVDLLSSISRAGGPLAFSPDRKTLVTTGDRQTLHSWDLATGQDRLATPDAHQGDVVALACLADRKSLVSGSRDRTVRIWDLATGRPTRMLPHDGWVESLSASADGSLLATGSAYPQPGKINLWDIKSGERLHTWSVGQAIIRGVSLSGDGSTVIAALADGSLRHWDISTEKERPIAQPKLEKFPDTGPAGGLSSVSRVVFSRDGQSAAFIGGGWVQVVDVTTGDRRFKEALGGFWKVCALAPDGRSLAIVREVRKRFQAGNWRGTTIAASTIVWLDGQTGHLRREIEIPESGVLALAFSPDGQAVAAGTLLTHPERGIIRIFRLSDKAELQTIESPCTGIEVLCFTPDGKRIVAGLKDTSIVIWDVHPMDDRR